MGAPRHGYGIVGEVAELSGGRVRLKVGTLYGVLDRLVGDSLVELDREEVAQGRLRRYYRLTGAGARALVRCAGHRAPAAHAVLVVGLLLAVFAARNLRRLPPQAPPTGGY